VALAFDVVGKVADRDDCAVTGLGTLGPIGHFRIRTHRSFVTKSGQWWVATRHERILEQSPLACCNSALRTRPRASRHITIGAFDHLLWEIIKHDTSNMIKYRQMTGAA
jgi:hypothetical protein